MTASPLQEAIVARTRQIDNLLFKLGGGGKNMRERAHRTVPSLDPGEARQLRRIVGVNHRMVYGGGFLLERDHPRFLAACEWVITRLERRLASRATTPPRFVGSKNLPSSQLFVRFTITLVALLLTAFLCMLSANHLVYPAALRVVMGMEGGYCSKGYYLLASERDLLG